MHGAPWV